MTDYDVRYLLDRLEIRDLVTRVAEVIEATMAELFGPTQHFMGNHQITIEGDRASGTTYCLAIHQLLASNDGAARMTSALRYVDRFIRTGDGWRIEHRRVTRDIAMDLPGRTAEIPADLS